MLSSTGENEKKKRLKQDDSLGDEPTKHAPTDDTKDSSKADESAKCKNDSDAEIVALLMGVKTAVKQAAPEGRESELGQKLNDQISPSTEETAASKDDAANSERSSPVAAEGSAIESGFMSFPEKIMMLLNKELASDAMWWLPDGDAFCILPAPFTEKVLDKHFQGTKFESFTRKLNRWGFKRVADDGIPSNAIAFYHNLFHKDKPELLKDMSGGKTKGPHENREKKNIGKGKDGMINPDLSSQRLAQREAFLELKREISRGGSMPQNSDDTTARQREHRSTLGLSQDIRGPIAGVLGQSSGRNNTYDLPQLRALLAQQMGVEGEALNQSSNDINGAEQLFLARNLNQLPVDYLLSNLSHQRAAEVEQLLSTSDVSRQLAQQRAALVQSNMSADSTRMLLQQLGSLNPLGSSDIAARLLTQRNSGLGSYGVSSDTALLLEQMNANQVNPETEMALRLLMAQQRGQTEPSTTEVAAALSRQQLESAGALQFSSSDIQSRLLAERLRAAEMRGISNDWLGRLLNQQMGGDQTSDSLDLRTRLMAAAASNSRMQQPYLSETGLTERQLYELQLLEQEKQRDFRARLSGGGFGR